MMRFTFRQLEFFAALPDHTTLSSAAAALHVSESTLSHSISELEKAVGVQLCLRRKAKGLSLTPAGHDFSAQARTLLRQAHEAVNRLSDRETGILKGPIGLGCHTGIAAHVLPAVLEGFQVLHPQVDISIRVGTDDELLPLLHSGVLDVAIVYDMALPPGLDRQVIYETEVLAILPAEHRLSGETSVALRDLEPEPLIMVDSTPAAENTYRILREAHVSPNLSVRVPTVELARALAGRGLGYSLLMSRPNTTDFTVEGRKVVAIPLEPRTGRASVVAVWPDVFTLTPRAEAVIEFMQTQLQDYGPPPGEHAGTSTLL